MNKKGGGLVLLILVVVLGGFIIWNANKDVSRVSFDSDGGSKVASEKVKDGEAILKPTDPVKEGYKFISWQLDGVDYDFKTPVTKSITLKAVWKKAHTVTVTLEGKDYTANVLDNELINFNDFNLPNKEDGLYVIFYYNLDGSEFLDDTPITSDLKITAKYVEYNLDINE